MYTYNFCKTLFGRILSSLVLISFVGTSTITPAVAQSLPSVLNLPAVGAMVTPTNAYQPTLIKGLTIHPENPLQMDFIVSEGDDLLEDEAFDLETIKLVKYFLAALTTPEEDMWVNLSPYERNRIVTDSFGDTIMGRDLLAQDYLLKQLTSSLMYPEDKTGQEFWQRVKTKAYNKFGTTDIPMNTFNKIWIIPQKAVVYTHQNNAFVVESELKVMLEEDYFALNEHLKEKNNASQSDDPLTGVSLEIVREVLIPEIQKEINTGKTFAPLRQIYTAVILADWYKANLKESLLGQAYVDQGKTAGIDTTDKTINQKIYEQYIVSFKQGVYDYIKEEHDPATDQVVPRKYFSGGVIQNPDTEVVLGAKLTDKQNDSFQGDHAMVTVKLDTKGKSIGQLLREYEETQSYLPRQGMTRRAIAQEKGLPFDVVKRELDRLVASGDIYTRRSKYGTLYFDKAMTAENPFLIWPGDARNNYEGYLTRELNKINAGEETSFTLEQIERELAQIKEVYETDSAMNAEKYASWNPGVLYRRRHTLILRRNMFVKRADPLLEKSIKKLNEDIKVIEGVLRDKGVVISDAAMLGGLTVRQEAEIQSGKLGLYALRTSLERMEDKTLNRLVLAQKAKEEGRALAMAQHYRDARKLGNQVYLIRQEYQSKQFSFRRSTRMAKENVTTSNQEKELARIALSQVDAFKGYETEILESWFAREHYQDFYTNFRRITRNKNFKEMDMRGQFIKASEIHPIIKRMYDAFVLAIQDRLRFSERLSVSQVPEGFATERERLIARARLDEAMRRKRAGMTSPGLFRNIQVEIDGDSVRVVNPTKDAAMKAEEAWRIVYELEDNETFEKQLESAKNVSTETLTLVMDDFMQYPQAREEDPTQAQVPPMVVVLELIARAQNDTSFIKESLIPVAVDLLSDYKTFLLGVGNKSADFLMAMDVLEKTLQQAENMNRAYRQFAFDMGGFSILLSDESRESSIGKEITNAIYNLTQTSLEESVSATIGSLNKKEDEKLREYLINAWTKFSEIYSGQEDEAMLAVIERAIEDRQDPSSDPMIQIYFNDSRIPRTEYHYSLGVESIDSLIAQLIKQEVSLRGEQGHRIEYDTSSQSLRVYIDYADGQLIDRAMTDLAKKNLDYEILETSIPNKKTYNDFINRDKLSIPDLVQLRAGFATIRSVRGENIVHPNTEYEKYVNRVYVNVTYALQLIEEALEDKLDQQNLNKAEDILDKAMAAPGGIDLDPDLFEIETKGDGELIFPILKPGAAPFQIQGLTPTIIHVVPIVNLPLMLGLVDREKDTDFGQNPTQDPLDRKARFEPQMAGLGV